MSIVYKAFGLIWAYGFPCPELISYSGPQTPDIRVFLGEVPKSLNDFLPAGPLLQVRPQEVLFRFPGVARYWIRGGHQIIVEPENGVDHQLRLFLLGTASALLLMQRGLLPLHASGVVSDKGAVLFVGHSGSGKSTLLAAFLERGYPMLTDDIAAIQLQERGPVVWPSFPTMKLWADSLQILGQETAELHRVRTADLAKFSVPIREEIALDAVPLYAMYVLRPVQEAAIRLQPLSTAKKFNVFLDHTWQKLTLKRLERHITHFQQVTAVANKTRVVQVNRPEKPFLLDELTNVIEADIWA